MPREKGSTGLIYTMPDISYIEWLLHASAFTGESLMTIPLDLLIGSQGNMYEITCAAIRRAYQITVAGDEELEASQGKVVSLAVRQVLSKKVEYRIEE
jgi:DNA-directed RNA polymerase subunit omega